jgi:hypothetical protein
MSQVAALAQLGSALGKITEACRHLGLDIENAALRSLLFASTIVEKNPALVGAIDGLSKQMIAFDNLGLLNTATFTSMQATGVDVYARLQSAAAAPGCTTRDALCRCRRGCTTPPNRRSCSVSRSTRTPRC